MTTRRLLIGIGGGSGSGKTTLARRIQEAAGDAVVAIVEVDAYYADFSHLQQRDRERLNFDHPDAIDWELLLEHLDTLCDGHGIEQPVYDFSSHSRADEVVALEPAPVVVVEGIHAFSNPDLRERLNLRIFVDTGSDIRFIRRLRRDLLSRDRSIDSVVEQYIETVRPMYNDYIGPSRRHADIILPEGNCNELGVDLLLEALVSRIERHVHGD
ncbi:MAG: uridine kinase [Fimbriimonadaceae bacterium]|nr:uridine kinase [Fimbriimonadaceae bacterium]